MLWVFCSEGGQWTCMFWARGWQLELEANSGTLFRWSYLLRTFFYQRYWDVVGPNITSFRDEFAVDRD